MLRNQNVFIVTNEMSIMPWINVIEKGEAQGHLKKLYNQVASNDGHIDNVLKIHSLRPRTLHAHLVLYKAVLHTKPNELSYRERELVGSFVSSLNGCKYCVKHHTAGLGKHVGSQLLAEKLVKEVLNKTYSEDITDREKELCIYAEKLTLHPQNMIANDLNSLKMVGLTDAGILDFNQIIAYFAYVNRMVTGLGVETAGEPLGLSPNESNENFGHS